MSGERRGLPEALELAAQALRRDADAIRPANGDPYRLYELAGAAGSKRVLGWLLANEPHAGEELAEAWADDPEGPGQALLALDAEALPKPARKILRRVMHGLRTRGVAVPEAAPAERTATLPKVEDGLDEARVTPFDPRGTRMVSLVASHPGGGVRLFQIAIDDARGVLDFEVLSAARRDVRRWLRESSRGEALFNVPVPPDSARALVARAAAHQPASRSFPRGFAEWRSRCAEAPGAKTPGELAREALAPADDASGAVARVAARVREGALGPWPPEPRRLQELALKVGDARGGLVVVSDAARRDQIQRVVDEACEEWAAGEGGAAASWRFEELAYIAWKAGREDDARELLAAAAALREPGAARLPLARAFLETWLAPLLREAPPQQPEAASAPLVVRP
jgi:hypothetical protein